MSEINRLYLPSNYVKYPDGVGEDRHAEVMKRFDQMLAYWSYQHQVSRREDEFLAGNQWPERIKNERANQSRPVLTFNRLPAYARQVVNKMKQDRPALKVRPIETNRSEERTKGLQGGQDYSLSEVYQGLMNHIQLTSRASQAYDTAAAHAVKHGCGFFALAAKANYHDPFVQDLRVERIRDSYSVLIDPSADKADFSDMQEAFMTSWLSKEAFAAKFPDHAGNADWGYYTSQMQEKWFLDNKIQVATYWWLDWRKDEVLKMTDGAIHYLSDVEDILDELERDGIYIARTSDAKKDQIRKEVKRPVCKWQMVNGREFLSEEEETVFEEIPIFPVVGDEVVDGGRIIFASAIRDGMDPQRAYNFSRTAGIETTGLQPKVPFLVTAEQINGHEQEWSLSNRTTKPFLTYNHIEGQPVPARMAVPQPASAELAQAQADAADIQNCIGLHEAFMGEPSNERTGKAVLARQQQGATSTYHYSENQRIAIERLGRMIVRAIPRIYDSERIVRIRLPDDSEDAVAINQEVFDTESNTTKTRFDIGVARFDVSIDTGPDYATMRQEGIGAMQELIKVMPPQALIPFGHLLVQQMAFPGSDKMSAVLRKMVPDQLKSDEDRAKDLPPGVKLNEQGIPVDEKTNQPWSPPPTPEQKQAQAEAQTEQAKLQAAQAKAQADMAMAEAKKVEAQMKMALAQAESQGGQESLDMDALNQSLAQAVQQAVEQHAQDPEAHAEAMKAAITGAVVELLPRIKQLVSTLTAEEAKRVEATISQRAEALTAGA